MSCIAAFKGTGPYGIAFNMIYPSYLPQVAPLARWGIQFVVTETSDVVAGDPAMAFENIPEPAIVVAAIGAVIIGGAWLASVTMIRSLKFIVRPLLIVFAIYVIYRMAS